MSAAVVDTVDTEAAAVKRLRVWRRDPVQFVRDAFGAEPDAWQAEALRAVARAPKVAMAACKGPGKSCVLAWVVWWFLATHVGAQVIGVSITADNLRDNLWKELAYWQTKSPLLEAAFKWGAERIVSREMPAIWWASARAFAKDADPSQQASTLAGFHGQNVLVVLDEIGDYPDGVLPAAEAIFANEVNAKLVVAGNPTSTSGPLYGIVSQPTGWEVIRITGDPDDPQRSPRISLEWAKAEIDKWGRDNPWVMVNILGLFPPAGANQLIGVNEVLQAQERDAPALAYRSDAIIWGLDPARFGDDEASLARRQGVLARRFMVWRNLDGTELGDAVAALILEAQRNEEGPDQIFVDVGGVGASAYDRLVFLGWGDIVQPVDFGGSPSDPRHLNKRAEIWWEMAQWLKRKPACLPNDPVLRAELTAPTFGFRVVNKRTVFVLESKEEMKKRGVTSPNRADALALTFSAPVEPRRREVRQAAEFGRAAAHAATDYDPLGRA